MIEFEIFPNMKNRCVTFSFDARHENDMRIVSLLNKYGIKATFYLRNELATDEICELYKGHEISYGLSNKYCRQEDFTMDCKIPDDFMEWSPSCNIKEAFELCDLFVKDYRSLPKAPLLHVFCKSNELKIEEDWIELERILQRLANNHTIWYATNTEVYEYISAQRCLIITDDEKCFYNPTNIDIWIKRNHTEMFCIPAGKKINFRNIE